jgi:hypothetical protein
VVGGNVKCIADHRKLTLSSCSAMFLFHYKLIFITSLALIIKSLFWTSMVTWEIVLRNTPFLQRRLDDLLVL